MVEFQVKCSNREALCIIQKLSVLSLKIVSKVKDNHKEKITQLFTYTLKPALGHQVKPGVSVWSILSTAFTASL